MKTLLRFIELFAMAFSHNSSNLGLKFWFWALETINHRFYPQGLEYKISHAT
jgi:hypothetical protein